MLVAHNYQLDVQWNPLEGLDIFTTFRYTDSKITKELEGVSYVVDRPLVGKFKGLVNVPELQDGDPNDFLTKLFATVRENLKKESETLAPQQKAYDELMASVPGMMEAITDEASANQFASVLDTLPHALTSKKEIGSIYKARCKEIGLKWDAKKKAWVAGDAKQ